ncbi:MAG: HAMP domain-containing sensor histidine kinase [Candidatus Sericytochromatia bacterium]|nr:HAMP domain-containing sensor histidine kinase [Candidatus Sericytochromatia bacterium]
MNDLQTLTLFTLTALLAGVLAVWTVWALALRRDDAVAASLLGACAGKGAILACQLWVWFQGRGEASGAVNYLEFGCAGLTALVLLRAARHLTGSPGPGFGLVFLMAGAAGASGAWYFNRVPFIVACLPVLTAYLAAHVWTGARFIATARRVGRPGLAVWGWSLLAYVAWVAAMMPPLLQSRWVWLGYFGEAWLTLVPVWWLAAALLHDRMRSEEATSGRRASEQARRRDLLLLVAESLRSPLAAIKTHAYVVSTSARGKLGVEEADMLAMVASRADHLVRLVADVHDYVKVVDGVLTYDRQPENLVSLVRQACGHEQAALRRRQLSLDVSLPVTPLMVDADRARLLQMLETLLGHARRQTPPGGVLRVRLSSVGEFGVLEVADSGEALAPDHLALLFSGPLVVDAAGAGPSPAEGLAFAIARHVVEEGHGGLLSVSSEEEVGTTFTVTLPLAEPAPVGEELPATGGEDQPDPWEGVLER